jgi:nucleoid-associated protein YgaU
MSIGGKFILLGAAFAVVLLVVVYGGGPAASVATLTVSATALPPPAAPEPRSAATTTRVVDTPRTPLAPTVPATAPSALPPAIVMGKDVPAELVVFAKSVAEPPQRSTAITDRPVRSTPVNLTIKPGDTLTAISARTLGDGEKWRRFVTANPGLNPNRLRVGQVLKIPGGVPTPSPPVANAVVAKPAQKTHRVGAGDTLTSIASTHYGDSSRWNDIFVANKKVLGGNPDQLRVDVVLLIP